MRKELWPAKADPRGFNLGMNDYHNSSLTLGRIIEEGVRSGTREFFRPWMSVFKIVRNLIN